MYQWRSAGMRREARAEAPTRRPRRFTQPLPQRSASPPWRAVTFDHQWLCGTRHDVVVMLTRQYRHATKRSDNRRRPHGQAEDDPRREELDHVRRGQLGPGASRHQRHPHLLQLTGARRRRGGCLELRRDRGLPHHRAAHAHPGLHRRHEGHEEEVHRWLRRHGRGRHGGAGHTHERHGLPRHLRHQLGGAQLVHGVL